MTDEIQRRASFQCAWLQLFPAQVCWSEGDYRGALGEIERHVDGLETLDEATQGDLGELCSYLYLALGKVQAVREIARQLPQRSRARTMANLSLFLDEYSSMGRTVSYLDRNNLRQDLILALARAGYVVEAEAMFSRLADRRSRASGTSASVEAMLGVVEAELALARGKEVHAIELLERSLGLYETAPSFYPSPLYFFGCHSLARLLEMRGDAEGAIRVMQNGSRPEWQHPYPTGPFPWIKHQWLLASLYRRLGKHQTAREIESELLKLLVYADADHPMLVEIKAREEADRPEA